MYQVRSWREWGSVMIVLIAIFIQSVSSDFDISRSAYRAVMNRIDALPSSRSTQSLIENGSPFSGRKRMLSAWALSNARIVCAIFAALVERTGSTNVPRSEEAGVRNNG